MESYFRGAPHFMPVLSKACQAGCKYCFGPNRGSISTLEQSSAMADFMISQIKNRPERKADITFHGGEPLMAPIEVWRHVLSKIRSGLREYAVDLHVQSNLWNLNRDYCDLFREHGVKMSTSIDGPEDITDFQRGAGYFGRTMRGYELAEKYGLVSGCIATFTSHSVSQPERVFDFFLQRRIPFTIHASVNALDKDPGPFSVTVVEYANLLTSLFDRYLIYRNFLSISTFDQLCASVAEAEGHICTYKDCYGLFMALDPEGNAFPCQRFAGDARYRLGNIGDPEMMQRIREGDISRRFIERQQIVKQLCGSCEHYPYCKGGCTYNAWTAGQEIDPCCEAYKAIFSKIKSHLLAEMRSPENLEAIVSKPALGKTNPLLRKGTVIELSQRPHPVVKTSHAVKILATVELGKHGLSPVANAGLLSHGLTVTENYLERLWQSIHAPRKLNNLYLHITFRCQLHCSHCYASASADSPEYMPLSLLFRLMEEAAESKFRQIVITGGEPLMHPQLDEMLQFLGHFKKEKPFMNLILRTNFTLSFTDEQLHALASSFHQIVVSVDGDQQYHDQRRGKGSYAICTENIRRYQRMFRNNPMLAELSVACVMPAKDIQGPLGQSVLALSHELKIKRTRFRPLLPLGRASEWEMPPVSEALTSHADPEDALIRGIHPVNNCGMGINLYVEPNGDAYPCYSFHKKQSMLERLNDQSLQSVLNAPAFKDLSKITVDSNPKCRACKYKYLCGGACRAWGGESTQQQIDAVPTECAGLSQNAERIHQCALDYVRHIPLIHEPDDQGFIREGETVSSSPQDEPA